MQPQGTNNIKLLNTMSSLKKQIIVLLWSNIKYYYIPIILTTQNIEVDKTPEEGCGEFEIGLSAIASAGSNAYDCLISLGFLGSIQ